MVQPTVLSRIEFQKESDTNRVVIKVEALRCQPAEAVLLSNSGEERQRFELHEGDNQLQFQHHQPGTYSLRIETGYEVTVRQIILTR